MQITAIVVCCIITNCFSSFPLFSHLLLYYVLGPCFFACFVPTLSGGRHIIYLHGYMNSVEYEQLPSPHEQKPERIAQPRKVRRSQSERDAFLDGSRHRRTHLPTPEQLLRLSAPTSSYISIDTSGENFKRLSLVRRSLTLQNLELSQRRRHRHGHMEWRSTIAGIPNAIDMEFERSSQGSSISTNALTEELRTQSLDRRMLKNKKRSYFTRRGISILSSLRLRKNSKLTLPPSEEEVLDQSSLKQLDQLPVSSWTGSLPRNVKLNADRTRNGSAQRGRIMNRWSGDYSTSDGSSNSSLDHTLPNGSIHHNGVGSLGRGSRNRGLRLQQSTVPDGIISSKPHTLSITHLDSINPPENRIVTGKPSVVTLRNRKPFQQPKEERRSSSGNWSGTDSNRTSLNSDPEIVQILSKTANGAQDGSPSDSAVSLSNEADQVTPTGQVPNAYFLSKDFGQYRGIAPRPSELSLDDNGRGGSDSGTPTPTNEEAMSQLTADKWLQSVSPPTVITPRSEAGNMAPASKTPNPAHYQPTFSDSSSESSEQPSLSALSDHSSIDLDLCLAEAVEEFTDTDSVSTSHSMDQDGYWTSMHFDCGFPYRKPSLSRLEKGLADKNPQTTEEETTPGLDVAPPPPKRVDSITATTDVSLPHGGAEKAESVISTSSSSSLTPTNFSDDNLSSTASLTDNASDISESSYTLPEPMQSPTQSKMYTLFFNEGARGGKAGPQVTTFDSQNKKGGGVVQNQQQNIFFGMFPSANSMNLPQRVSFTEEDDNEPLSPGGTPKSPLGLYPDNYNTMKRKNKPVVGFKADAMLHHDIVRVPPAAPSVSDSRRSQFNGKNASVNDGTPPQQQGDVKVNAMSHEERAEILQMLRNSRNSGSSVKSGPMSPSGNSQNMLMLQVDKGQVSFRETYKENVQDGKLDPDKAIIQAAKQIEEIRREKEAAENERLLRPSSLPLEEESSSSESDDSSPNKTPIEIYPYIDYIYDPSLKPKSSILKKTPAKKKDDTQILKEKIAASKKKLDIDPFEEVLNPSKDELQPPTAPKRRISFSKYVHVDNRPVKMCNTSGRPVTRRDGFVALECELGSNPAPQHTPDNNRNVKRPSSAELLYRGSVLNDKSAPIASAEDDVEEEEVECGELQAVQEEKQFQVVRVTAVREVAEVPRSTVQMISIPPSDSNERKESQRDNAGESSEQKTGKPVKVKSDKPDELDALLAELVQFSKENDELWGEEGETSAVVETQIDEVTPKETKDERNFEQYDKAPSLEDKTAAGNNAGSSKHSDEELEALFQSLKLNNNESELKDD
ncbi:uncharacterized protein [Apostichopus japonicus]|uniref:uncharacterized protein isoform X3 n=1 Tax=Stichopus japonicus TaxID=307972 RepID=UPI003AB8EE5D